MQRQTGFTLTELLTVVAIASLLLAVVGAYSVPMIARETMKGAVYDVQTFLQLARIEAVSRNRDCRFVVDAGQGALRVFDSMGTGSDGDDELLYERVLPNTVAFDSPDGADAVTLSDLGDSAYEAVFSSDGTVSAGSGQVVVFGGEAYGRVSLYAAGGLAVQSWNGNDWISGT